MQRLARYEIRAARLTRAPVSASRSQANVMMMQKALLALALAAGTAAAAGDCKASTLDFVMLEGEASHAAIEEDIRKELAVVGIEVVPRVLNKEDFNTAMIDGDFTATWT